VVSGDVVQATGLTESESGSDAAALRTTAVREGDHYRINGSKCFISNGYKADLLYVIAKTNPAAGSRGTSVILVPAGTAGLTRRLQKTMGFCGGDTAELFFDDVKVPLANLLGKEGEGLKMFQPVISLDRMQICARSLGSAESAFEMTLEYVKNRKLFKQRLVDFQNTQFKLAEMETELVAGRCFLNSTITRFRAGQLTDFDTSKLNGGPCAGCLCATLGR
jgi:alkylation response protein AidB-like acyl-CoA dehydrogenase